MKIKEAKYKTVMRKQSEQVAPEVYGCDHCKNVITRGTSAGGKHRSYLEANIFSNSQETTRMEFCSWLCCLLGLEKVETDYFISLPYLIYDEDQGGIRAADFFNAMRQFAAGESKEKP